MDYFAIENEKRNTHATYFSIPLYLNLSQLDPSIKNIYAEILLVSYFESILPSNKKYLCDNTNILVHMKYIDAENNIINDIYNDEYKQLIKDFMYQYPFFMDIYMNKNVKIAPGHLFQINQDAYANRIKIVVECANNFPDENDAVNLITKVLNSTDGIETELIDFKKQKSFSNKEYKYKMGRCLVYNFYMSLLYPKPIYVIQNNNNTLIIRDDNIQQYKNISMEIYTKLKEIMFNLQKEINKPAKIFIDHLLYDAKKICSQLTDIEYLKNDII